ncbi:MAG: sulfite exporter TauE/SafE family protein, partial [Microcoleus sp.]
KQGAIFGSATMLGAYLGARIATLPLVTSALQMTLFALSMLLAAGLMIYRTSRAEPALSTTDELNSIQYIKPVCKYCWLWLMTEGLGVGILTGLVGVGGGFAIVPALVLLGNVPMKKAIGTSLLIISCNSLAGILGYLGHISLDWNLTVSFTFLAGCGTLIGAYLAQFVSAQQLQKGFGYFLLVVAAFVLAQNRHSFESPQESSAYPQSHNRVQRMQ